MDLGIAGRHAVVCGASKGLGYGCAEALAAEGVRVTLIARGATELDAAVVRLKSLGYDAGSIRADVATEAGQTAIVSAAGEVDILVNNAAGPPPGRFRDWSRADWIAAFDANMLSAVFLTRAFIDGMIARRFGRIVNITSIAVKQPLPMLGLSTSARLALTGFVAAIAREVAQHNVTVNNLLPGYFDTARLRKTLETWASQNQLAPSDAARVRQSTVPAQRFGEPGEFGQVCAFLCSKHASYVTGQNILLDGGLYSGTF